MGDNGIIVPTDEEIKELAVEVKKAAIESQRKQFKRIPGEYYYDYQEQIEAIRSSAEWIPDKFDSFLAPYPWDFTDKLDALDSIASKLGTGLDREDMPEGDIEMIDTAKGWMQQWRGRLSDDFTLNYLTPMTTIAQNQGRLTLILRDHFKGMRNIYAEGRRSLVEIGENAVKAFEAADGMPANGWKALLTVLSTAFGLGTAALSKTPAAAGASVTTALVAGGIGIGSNEISDTEMPLGAEFPDEVMENLEEAIKQLEKDIEEKEDEIIKALDEATMELRSISFATMLIDGVQQHEDKPLKGSAVTPPMPQLVLTGIDDASSLPDGLLPPKK